MTSILPDLRHALRSLRRSPGSSAVAIATLALGIGASTAIFSLFSAVVLRLPFRDSARLLRIYDTRLREDGQIAQVAVTQRNFWAVREQARSFSSVAAGAYHDLALGTPEGNAHAVGIGVSDQWLRTLGVKPALGRDFTDEESRLGSSARAVIVSDAFWKTRLGGIRSLSRQRLTISGEVFDVVGVMPEGFRFPWECDLWLPWTFDRSEGREHNLIVIGRLATGATTVQARAELETLSARLARTYPDTNRTFTILPQAVAEDLIHDRGRLLKALGFSVAMLLLIACSNVAGLLLVRALSRAPEYAIRTALGATRARHFRQAFFENATLTLTGGCLGAVASIGLRGFLTALLPAGIASLIADVRPGLPAVAGMIALAVVAAALVSLAPLPYIAGQTLGTIGASRMTRHRATQRAFRLLTGGEIAASMLLLTASAIFVENFIRLSRANLGFDTENMLTATVAVPEGGEFGPVERDRLESALLDRIRAIPGVTAAAAADHLPLMVSNRSSAFVPEGRAPDPNQQLLANHREVTGGYFETLRIPVIRGRSLTAEDRRDSLPVCVISRAMAARFWTGIDPIGKRIRQLRANEALPWRTVVGVVDDVREPRLSGEMKETWYIPASQSSYRDRSWDAREIQLALRTAGSPGPIAGELRQAVAAIDPTVSVFDVTTESERRGETFAPERTSARLLFFFAAASLLLASLGTYAVVSYVTSRRQREIGIKAALGATPSRLLIDSFSSGGRTLVGGVAVGLAGAVVVSRALSGIASEVDAASPWRIAAVGALLLVAGALATFIPARRAAKTDPMTVLRNE